MNKENSKGNLKSGEKQSHRLDLDFGDTLEKLKREYLDVYKGIQSEILSTTLRFACELLLRKACMELAKNYF